MITLFPGYLYLLVPVLVDWKDKKMLWNLWGSLRYVIICYLNTIYAAEGKSNGCVCPTLYRQPSTPHLKGFN